MLDPDAAKRAANLAYVTERLALAEAVGARCCVDIAGSFSPTVWYGPHPKNLSQEFFDLTVENCRRVLDAVKPRHTTFTIEMMGWSLPDGPDAYLKLIAAVDRPAFAVHMDVCNGINSPQRFYENAAFIRECFAKLGKWTVSCHAKDLAFIPEMNVHFKEVVPGTGQIDYATYLSGAVEARRRRAADARALADPRGVRVRPRVHQVSRREGGSALRMTTRTGTSTVLAVLATLCATAAQGSAQDEAPTPVALAVRQFVRALAMHDAQAFTAATLPHPRGTRSSTANR